MVTTITPVTFLAPEIHHSASCLASTQPAHEGEEVTNTQSLGTSSPPAELGEMALELDGFQEPVRLNP
jgi:hypothetical protein